MNYQKSDSLCKLKIMASVRVRSWLLGALSAPLFGAAYAAGPADLVMTDARVYTADRGRSMAEAIAVQGGRIVFVGSASEAMAWVGPQTMLERVDGRMILPGLFDSHIHPIDMVKVDMCSLENRPRKTLRELSSFVRSCIRTYRPEPGQWLFVDLWNYTDGNQPDEKYSTVRAALDEASASTPIELMGSDGHHGGYNSAALGMAKNAAGATVGLSKKTIAGEFAPLVKLIAVDANGEPNGILTEDARQLLETQTAHYDHLEASLRVARRIPQQLNSVGITGMLDAQVAPEGLVVYDKLLKQRQLTVRTTLAQYYDPEAFRSASGKVDYDAMLAQATAIRARYAANPLLSADTVKLFADGVMEGNPYEVPPTLPNSPTLKPYLQPIFAIDAAGRASVRGYVDTGSALCMDVRANPSKYDGAADVAEFRQMHGFHPSQCTIGSGRLEHDPSTMLEFCRRFHLAGFNLHIHAIGDAAVRAAVDGIEAARAADGNSTTRDGIAHLQLGAPEDVARIGRDHIYIVYTYSWGIASRDYDLSVIPFIQEVSGNDYAALHVKGSYYESNAYPFRSSKDAGAILVAGSDAPVDTHDPRPFVNMAIAVTRRLRGEQPLNADQGISIREVIDAYTINGARFLGREAQAGSIEVGKSADFIVIDRDILALADRGKAEEISGTKVLQTWFLGKRVYHASSR
jgi:predicted amidohydrolase YtcJ